MNSPLLFHRCLALNRGNTTCFSRLVHSSKLLLPHPCSRPYLAQLIIRCSERISQIMIATLHMMKLTTNNLLQHSLLNHTRCVFITQREVANHSQRLQKCEAQNMMRLRKRTCVSACLLHALTIGNTSLSVANLFNTFEIRFALRLPTAIRISSLMYTKLDNARIVSA